MTLTIEQILTQLSTAAPDMRVVVKDWLNMLEYNDLDVWADNGTSVMFGYATNYSVNEYFAVADVKTMLKYNPAAFGDFPTNNPTDMLYFSRTGDPTHLKMEFVSVEIINGIVVLNACPIDYL